MKFNFANCTLDEARLTLTRDGLPVSVEPRVLDLIQVLVRSGGDLVTRDQLVEDVWQGRIVSESAISACVAAARKAVGDDGKAQAVIRTVARRGLIMAADVTTASDKKAPSTSSAAQAVQRIRYTQDKNGHQLAYSVTGSGPDVLRFPPPFTIDLEYEWRLPCERQLIETISEKFRYIRFDHVGSGQSMRVEPEFSFSALAEEALAVVDAVGTKTFSGVSYSGGVHSAIHFAARYPERLERLVIVGGYADGRVKRGKPVQDEALKTMIAEGWGKPDSPFATAFLTSYLPEGPLEDVAGIVKMMQAACSVETMLRDRDAINSASLTHLLKDVRCPVLLIHSKHDAVHPVSEARKLAAGIPNAELVLLDTANHNPLPANSVWDEFIETLVNFLEH